MTSADSRRLSLSVYRDKLAGGWIGQMIGVAYGGPYEFRAVGHTDEGEIRPWKPEYLADALNQDDLYVEMTWLACLREHGLEPTPAQAAGSFAITQFPLWHANQAGRENVRRGLLPPASGHPDNNPHANDIDYQIESDVIGLICPGLPQEANRLGWLFGHIMNYGDGVYGGLFMQGMYAAAYFESSDVRKVVAAGLACIPAESLYARCIRRVLELHRTHPDDWRVAWAAIEREFNDDRDCMPGPYNIDAHINGAYVVIGLLYGGDDLWKVCEIATRCGQDSDCNPSSAAGVWGCMHGRSGFPPEAVAGLPAIADREFSHTRFNYARLLEACEALTRDLVRRAGGAIRPAVDDAAAGEELLIPGQQPVPAPLEQWESPLNPPPTTQP